MPELKLTEEMIHVWSHFVNETWNQQKGNGHQALRDAGVDWTSQRSADLGEKHARVMAERGIRGLEYWNDAPEWNQSMADKGATQIKQLFDVEGAVRTVVQCLKVISPNDPSSLLIHSTAETILRIETEENDPENMTPEDFAMHWFQSSQGQ